MKNIFEWCIGLACVTIIALVGISFYQSIPDRTWQPPSVLHNGVYQIGIKYVDHPGQEAVYSYEGDGCVAYVVRPARSELDPYYTGEAVDYPGFNSLGTHLLACLAGQSDGRLDVWPTDLFWNGLIHFTWRGKLADCGTRQAGVLACNWSSPDPSSISAIYLIPDSIAKDDEPVTREDYATVLGHEVFHSVCWSFHDNKRAGDACYKEIL